MVDRSLELNERMSLVVERRRQSFAILAEVCIVADDTLVSHTLDVRLVRLALAKRAIAIDAVVGDRRGRTTLELLINGGEAVTRMSVTSILEALAAVVEVRAVEALVAHTMNHLVTTITDSSVSEVAASWQKGLLGKRESSTIDCGLKVVTGVVTMGVDGVAVQAEVVVITLNTCDKVAVWKRHNTGIASAG